MRTFGRADSSPQPHSLAPTSKCLAQSNKSRPPSKATKRRN